MDIEKFNEENILKVHYKKCALEQSVRQWYIRNYPTDSLGKNLSPNATFQGIFENIKDVYTYMGIPDSLVRERVFSKLADIKECEYEEIYKKWLK